MFDEGEKKEREREKGGEKLFLHTLDEILVL